MSIVSKVDNYDQKELANKVMRTNRNQENSCQLILGEGGNDSIIIKNPEEKYSSSPNYMRYNQAKYISEQDEKLTDVIRDLFPNVRNQEMKEMKEKKCIVYKGKIGNIKLNDIFIDTKNNFMVCMRKRESNGETDLRSFYFKDEQKCFETMIFREGNRIVLNCSCSVTAGDSRISCGILIPFIVGEKLNFNIYTDADKKNNAEYSMAKIILFELFENLFITEDPRIITKHFSKRSANKVIALNSKLRAYKKLQMKDILQDLNEENAIPNQRVYKFPYTGEL
jgi:hypothetical protein